MQGDPSIACPFEIMYDALDCHPVSLSVIVRVAAQLLDGERNVRVGAQSCIHERTNGLCVWYIRCMVTGRLGQQGLDVMRNRRINGRCLD